MKKNMLIFLALLLAVSGEVRAQLMEGVIVYEEVASWSKLAARLDFLSQEEKDRMRLTWKNFDEDKVDKKLVFNNQSSLYTYASAQREYGNGSYTQKNPTYAIHRDFAGNARRDWVESLGRVYQIEDSLQVPQWKIMNKIKDIQGHICMMAVTEDTIQGHKITAWFADDLPVPVGPGAYFGLPGAILELEVNDGDVVVTAKTIEIRAVNDETQPSKKLKGKKVTGKAYDELISKHIADSKKSRRNPFWAMPVL